MQISRLESAIAALKQLAGEVSLALPLEGLPEQIRRFSLARFSRPSLRIGNKVARTPVVQGGMGVGISLSGLASAVANAGGVGVIAANAIGLLEKDYFRHGRAANLRALRREIRSARAKSDGIIGMNIMVAVNDFHELLDVAIEERVEVVPIRNEFITRPEQGKSPNFRCAWQCLASCKADAARFCISLALNNARKGRIDRGFVFVSSNAYRVKEIVPVSSLVGELADGFAARAREALSRRLEAVAARVREARDSGRAQVQRRYDDLVAGVAELRAAFREGLPGSG